MRVGQDIQAVEIKGCPNEFYWYQKHIGETVHVADSGEPDEWYVVTGEHEGKQVLKSVCSKSEMTLIDMETEKPNWMEKVSA